MKYCLLLLFSYIHYQIYTSHLMKVWEINKGFLHPWGATSLDAT